jgi:hypothetical protein
LPHKMLVVGVGLGGSCAGSLGLRLIVPIHTMRYLPATR